MASKISLIRHALIQYLRLLGLTTLLAIGGTGSAAALSSTSFVPDTLYLQIGKAEHNTQAYIAGATWDWSWRKQYSFGAVSGYSEASFGRWSTDFDRGGSTWATQVGITPVLRWQPQWTGNWWAQNWFAEIGIGANLILPIYRSDEKSFSTEFNFGDHLAVGKQFGEHNRHELAVRIQHFSNGGIDHPNPGENFVQLRYSWRL